LTGRNNGDTRRVVIFNHDNYRSFLRETLVERTSKNPNYSLRAFARNLGVAPSSLSEVLKGKKNISIDSAKRIAGILRLNQKATQYLCLLAELEIVKSESRRNEICAKLYQLNPESKTAQIALDSFKMISDWYHYPIMELTTMKSFKFTASNIAVRLGISGFEAESAISRLKRLGLIERVGTGRYRKCASVVSAESPQPHEGLRIFHKQMLEKAIVSLETQSPQQKAIGSETFAFDEKLLPKAKELIDEFFSGMQWLAGKNGNPTHIYHLGVQFLQLTKGSLT
jgi:uncharacterized protein (TIGR02147 family)